MSSDLGYATSEFLGDCLMTMSILMLLGALALWAAGALMLATGETAIHTGFGFLTIGMGVLALGLGGVCEGLANVRRALEEREPADDESDY